ncbi:alpha/beta hydrolase [Cellulomonas sp. PhB143]|uniref:alpha/beta hydrolase n=1 Tax=Cellulomonas sp. PhB143 TaxID=2485186 RepID=UPI000F4615C6|nr:alpha/beta hydrolase [Cellulomonas sp. PhB143]ROS78976.1 alpha/beta hydrolase family protein [Cellulomonas sp. PhB143]
MTATTSPSTRAVARTVRTVATALLAAALLLVPLGVLVTTGNVVRHQHWSYRALLGASVLAGAALLAAVVLELRHPRAPAAPRHRAWRATGAALLAVVLVGLAASCAYLRPFGATPRALEALASDDAVTVHETSRWYTFEPAGAPPTVGLVYSPGARVDVRATAAVLRPLAEAGYLVVSLKEPLGIALTAPGQSQQAIDAYPGVERWATGGHSLGGVTGADFAGAHPDEVSGVLLHASYPLDDLSRTDLTVTSVSGSRDGLSTPAKIDASRAKLPPSATFVEVQGAVHVDFADYGPQPGDGTPTIDRADAQRQIVAASLDLLGSIAP